MEFKDWLRQQILNKGYTQEEFGEMVGVTGPAVNSWLQGRRKPTIKRAINIAKVLRISPEDVLFKLEYISNPSSDKIKGLIPEQSLTWI